MRHQGPVPLVSPRSFSLEPVALRGPVMAHPPDSRLAVDYFGEWATQWPSDSALVGSSARLQMQRAATVPRPPEMVVFSARGTRLVVRIQDIPPSLLSQRPVWGNSYLDERDRRHVYVNFEAATLHRVLDFYRDKEVPLSLAPDEVRALKRAAEMLEDRELLCHVDHIWPFRVEARDAKGTPSYPDKLFALASAWEQCGYLERAEKKRTRALEWYLASLPAPETQLSLPMAPRRQPSEDILLFPFEDDSSFVAPLFTSGWQRSSSGSQNETGWASSSSDGPPVPWTPSPASSLNGAMDFPRLETLSNKRAAL